MAKRTFRKRYKKKGKKTLTQKVAKLAKMVKSNYPETKHIDIVNTGVTVDNNPTFNIAPYRSISQGITDFGERIGDEIVVKKVKCRFLIYRSYVTHPFPTQYRLFAFIYKKNPDSITSTWSTIVNLYLSSTTMNSALAPMAWRDWDNNTSFKTLYDKMYPLNYDYDADKMFQQEMMLTIPKQYQRVKFATASTAPTDNELFIGMITTGDIGTIIDGQIRVSYTDA